MSKLAFSLSVAIVVTTTALCQNTFYVSPSGSDNASGTTPSEAWKTIDKLNQQTFAPGDQVLFQQGGTFLGMFHLKGSGTQTQPIVVGSFGDPSLPAPTIDGNGFQTALLVYNDSFIKIEQLNITNQASHLDDNGQTKKLSSFWGKIMIGALENVRFGIKVVADSESVQGIDIENVQIHDIYPTPTNSDNKHLGYGIKFENRSDTLSGLINTINNVSISETDITKTGHSWNMDQSS